MKLTRRSLLALIGLAPAASTLQPQRCISTILPIAGGGTGATVAGSFWDGTSVSATWYPPVGVVNRRNGTMQEWDNIEGFLT